MFINEELQAIQKSSPAGPLQFNQVQQLQKPWLLFLNI
jgi:hypothetical protein